MQTVLQMTPFLHEGSVVAMSSDVGLWIFPDGNPKKNHPGAYILRALDLGTQILVSRLMHVRGRPHNTMMRFAWGFVPGLCHETPPKGIGQL